MNKTKISCDKYLKLYPSGFVAKNLKTRQKKLNQYLNVDCCCF